MVDAIRIGRGEDLLKQLESIYHFDSKQRQMVKTVASIEGSDDLLVVFEKPTDSSIVTFFVGFLSLSYLRAVDESDITMIDKTSSRVRG